MFRKIKIKPQQAERDSTPGEFLLTGLVEVQHKPTIISEGCCIQGKLVSVSAMHIDGEVDGNVEVESLTIGQQGRVKGEIKCRTLTIIGHFEGVAECDELSLAAQAVVRAKVHYKRLKAALGATIHGELLVR
ncbi:MAG: hypothetical protein RLZZ22_1297 [Pseudomonadota bacterium]|jgi:cytoskeletal protein CcmA (bactofilin family)